MDARSDWQEVKEDDFDYLKVIGRGSVGKVLLVRRKGTGKIYALKIVPALQVAGAKSKVCTYESLDSPFLVKIHCSFHSATKKYVLMDYIPAGELFYQLWKEQQFSVDKTRFYAAEIVLALEHLHAKNIVHGNLKPENILLSAEGHICITEYKSMYDEHLPGTPVTFDGIPPPEYTAPEILKGQASGYAIDFWSLGILLYEMLTGLPPYYSEDIHLMYKMILTGQTDMRDIHDQDAQDIITAFLEREPDKRLVDPNRIKEHPFFASIDWEKLKNCQISPPYIPPPPYIPAPCFPEWEDFEEDTGTARAQRESSINSFAGFTWVGATD